jgi:hypothetical protein
MRPGVYPITPTLSQYAVACTPEYPTGAGVFGDLNGDEYTIPVLLSQSSSAVNVSISSSLAVVSPTYPIDCIGVSTNASGPLISGLGSSTTVSWTTPFKDSNYAAVCNGVFATGANQENDGFSSSVVTKTTDAVTIPAIPAINDVQLSGYECVGGYAQQ